MQHTLYKESDMVSDIDIECMKCILMNMNFLKTAGAHPSLGPTTIGFSPVKSQINLFSLWTLSKCFCLGKGESRKT